MLFAPVELNALTSFAEGASICAPDVLLDSKAGRAHVCAIDYGLAGQAERRQQVVRRLPGQRKCYHISEWSGLLHGAGLRFARRLDCANRT